MPTIITRSVDDFLSNLPQWTIFSGHAGQTNGTLFIGTVGFEQRSPACFESWCGSLGEDSGRAMLIRYPTNKQENDEQWVRFESMASAHEVTITSVQYSAENFFESIQEELKTLLNRTSSVLLDISTISSYVFYPLFKALLLLAEDRTMSIVYAEAETYFPSKGEWVSFQERTHRMGDLLEKARAFDAASFQSEGVGKVYECPLYCGLNLDKNPCRLLMVPNFSHERANQMISYVVDKYGAKRDEDIEWLIGMPPDQDENYWRHDALWDLYQKPIMKHSVSTLDYQEMLKTLHDIWERNRFDYSLVIANLGSKSQHLATALFLEMHQEIGLVLSEPKQFVVKRYSEGTGRIHITELGPISTLRRKIATWNEIEFVWELP